MLLGMLHAAGMCLQVEKVKEAVETAKAMRSDLFLEGQCCCIGYKCLCVLHLSHPKLPILASLDTRLGMRDDVSHMMSKVHVQWLSYEAVTHQSCTQTMFSVARVLFGNLT